MVAIYKQVKASKPTLVTPSVVVPRIEPVIVARTSKSAKRSSITTLHWAGKKQTSSNVENTRPPVTCGKLEQLDEDLSYCKRVIKRARAPLTQRVLNRDNKKGDVIARGATHAKMTLISLGDAQGKPEIVYHSVDHLDNRALFGRGFRTDLISLTDARQRAEIKYRTVL